MTRTVPPLARAPSGSRRAVLLALLALTPGCGLLTGVSEAPGKLMDAATGSSKPAPIDPAKVRLQATQLASDAIIQIGTACHLFAAQDPRPEAKLQAARWAFHHTTRVLTAVSHPKPGVALVDLLLFVGVQRILYEEHWIPDVHGEAARPLLVCFQQLQDDAVRAIARVFTVEQQEALRSVLQQWRADNPDLGTAARLEPPTLTDLEEQGKAAQIPLISDVFSLLKVDPLGGLEPVAREVGLVRELGERSLFFAEHLPYLVSLQVELHTLEILEQPEIQRAVAEAERVSLAAESFATTAAALPAALSKEREAAVAQIARELATEREAALRQLSDELTAQRAGLVADLERTREPLTALLAESRATLEAGSSMSASLTLAIQALDAFLAGFEKPAPEPGAAPSAPAEPAAPAGKPFDIVEYGVAAEKIGVAARELEAAITGLDASLPRVRAAVDLAAERAEQSVELAYGKALRLVLWSTLGIALAVLLVRRLSPRRAREPATRIVLGAEAPPAGRGGSGDEA